MRRWKVHCSFEMRGRCHRYRLLVVVALFYGFLFFNQSTNEFAQRSEVKVNPYPYKVTIPASHICDDHTDMIVLVNSAYENLDKRRAVRETWARYVQNGRWIHGETINNWNIKVAFIFGVHENPEDNRGMIEEANRMKDVIMGDFIDSYRNITLKSLMGIRWVTEYCPAAKYLLKCDDDVIINFPAVLKQLESSELKTNSIWGPLTLNAKVQRVGKYHLSHKDYPHYYFPPYMRGSAYVMSADILRSVFVASEYVPGIPIDDVYITGILAKILGISLHTTDREKWGKELATHCGLLTGFFVVGFYRTAQEQMDVWVAMQEMDQSKCVTCSLLWRMLSWCPKRTSIQL